MKLLIDAGNMRIKWAIASVEEDQIIANGVLDSDWSALAPYAKTITSVWVSCVANSAVLEEIRNSVRQLCVLELNEVSVSSEVAGLRNNYHDLARLGVDRWVAALGARQLVDSGNLIVIDAGTAVTVDLVTAKNSFEGGAILPGFEIMHDALVGRTAGIESKRQAVKSVVGKNTRDCVNSGVHFGLIGAIERVVEEMQISLKDNRVRILMTGGDAEIIASNSKLNVELQSDLMFHGLMLLSKQ